MKNRVLVYVPNQFNVCEYSVDDVSEWAHNPNAIVNPKMDEFRHIPRQHIKIINKVMLEMSQEEKNLSNAFHKSNISSKPSILTVEKIVEVPKIVTKVEIKEVIKEVPVEVETKVFPKTNFALGSAIGALVQYLIQKYLGG